MPLGRPLYEPTLQTRVSGHRRELERLKNRSSGRWVYPGGIPTIDAGGIDGSVGGNGWQNSWDDSGDGTSSLDGLTRYRWTLGGSTEFVINAVGGVLGTIMFTLLPGYWDAGFGKQTFAAADSNGFYVCYTIVPRVGDLTIADVYAGRV